VITPDANSPGFASLTSFDWCLVIVAVVSTVLAFLKGFVRVLFSLAGMVVGVLLASWEYLRLAAWLGRWVRSRPAAEAIAFLTILFAVTIVFSLAAGFVRRTVKAIGLGFMDRLLGAGVGLVRGVLLGVAAMMAIAAFDPHSRWTQNSVLSPYFLAGARAVSFVVPQHFQEQVSEGTRHLVGKKPDVLRRSILSK
jgi:membrane protein required for colicin V production